MTSIVPSSGSPFDSIRHTDEQGNEYWLARELMPLLEYEHWQDFDGAIGRAIEDCAKSERDIKEHFRVFRRSPNNPTGGRPPKDYQLSRYACHLVVMASRTLGDIAAHARTYFSDVVVEAEQIQGSDALRIEWRRRAILSFQASGYSAEWAERRADDILARNDLTSEWVARGIQQKEIPILSNELHMGSFGVSIHDHKGVKDFPITYKGKKIVYKDDLPPAMTATELALNALASTVSRELHIANDSQGYPAITRDVRKAGEIVGRTRKDIEEATGRPVVSPNNMLKLRDGGLPGMLPAPTDDSDDPQEGC